MATESVPVSSAAATGPAADAIVIEGLVRRFGERDALAGVTASLGIGETLAVLGPNGAGKTTLLRVLATLLRQHAGRVQVLGSELPRDAHAVRGRIGFVGHEPMLYRELSARENLVFYARLYDVDDPEGRVDDLLEATAMSNRADEPVRVLSQGMVKRLAICRAVLAEPDLLLLDEPLAGLDPDAETLVEPLIGRRAGRTRVLVTHDVERSLDEADHVIALRGGRVLLHSAARDLQPSQLRPVYGGERR
jgi:ABC-type multidrug transport system ATPase subunit